MFGSVLMLLCILYLVFKYHELTGIWSFNLFDIKKLLLPASIQLWLFLGFGLAFAIKVPMFPFHTWLPDAHVEAPTAGSVILAAVLLKMGTYGFIRFAMPLFPIATEMFAPFIGGIAICGIIYGACVAWMQQDIKSLVAYSSVSHLGFVMLGLFAMNERGIMGAIYQMLNHGISTGGLFLLVGVLYERRHTRLIDEFGGLAAQMPRYATIFMIITLSSVGLPGLNNFIGEFLVLIGSFHSTFFSYPKLFTMLATIGIILGAVYMLWMYLKVFFGPLKKPENQVLKDLSLREGFVLVPIVILIFVMGFFPNIFLKRMEPSVKQFLVQYKAKIEQSYKYEKEIAENPELKSKAKLMEPPEIVILPLDEPEVHLPIKIKK
jgi:NADH-quinone oxidoreductase subunit M